MNDSDTTPMSGSADEDEHDSKWKTLPPAPKQLKPHPRDGRPSEYGVPVGVDDHPLRAYYREASKAEEQASGARREGDTR